jgi:hypothetical protein
MRIYKRIILLVVLYECETWSLTLREEHKLRVVENRVLRRIFGPKMDGVMGGGRKVHNEKFRVSQMGTSGRQWRTSRSPQQHFAGECSPIGLLTALLVIGGVELNPGPHTAQVHE